MITFKHKGNFNKTERFLKKNITREQLLIIEKYAQDGVNALSSATPVDSGLTARSWDYQIQFTKVGLRIIWTNSHIDNGVPIAIVLQYGHGTRNGGYVQGKDYINPAIEPIFTKIDESLWKEVCK